MKKSRQHRYKRRKKQRNLVSVFGAVIAVILLTVVIVIAAGSRSRPSEKDTEAGTVAAEDGTEDRQDSAGSRISFPYRTDDGKLEVTSLFQSSIMNPDCDGEYGEDIASLEMKNLSDRHLSSASIDVTLADGSVLQFIVADIPAGKTVWVFETGNTSIPSDAACASIAIVPEYEGETPLMQEQIKAEVSDTEVLLTNLTDEDLTDIVVDCHCLFEGAYFGGLTYSYPVDVISAGGTAVIEADDCYMGSAEVVRIARKNEGKQETKGD